MPCDCSNSVEMPAEVRALAEPWPTLVGSTPGLTPELEKDFRFGQLVIEINGQCRIGGNLKGGSSTLWYPAGEAERQAYLAWRAVDGIPECEDPAAYEQLLALLGRHQVELVHGSHRNVGAACHPGYGWLYRAMEQICRCLPEPHLANPHLRRLQIGGWGPDSAKGSAYDDGAVMMYDFAISGARRTFLGLFLHELGHAQQERFDPGELSLLREQYTVICRAGAILGTEFLLDARTRQIYQRLDFGEFLAETYMHYCSQGERLRRYIATAAPPEREAWSACYLLFKEAFEGVEYA